MLSVNLVQVLAPWNGDVTQSSGGFHLEASAFREGVGHPNIGCITPSPVTGVDVTVLQPSHVPVCAWGTIYSGPTPRFRIPAKWIVCLGLWPLAIIASKVPSLCEKHLENIK